MAGIFFNYHFRVVLHLDIFPTCRVAQGRLALAWRDRARSPADYHAHYHQGSQGRFRISALYKQGRLRCCIFTTLSPIAPPPLYGVEPSRRRANPDVIPWKQYQFYQAKHIHGCSKAGGLSSYCDRVVSHLKPVLTQALTLVCSALVAHWEPPGGKRSYCFFNAKSSSRLIPQRGGVHSGGTALPHSFPKRLRVSGISQRLSLSRFQGRSQTTSHKAYFCHAICSHLAPEPKTNQVGLQLFFSFLSDARFCPSIFAPGVHSLMHTVVLRFVTLWVDAPCGIRTLMTDLEVAEGAFREEILLLYT